MPVHPYMYIQYIYNTKSFACWKHTDMRTTCLTGVGSVDFWRGLVVAGTKTCALKSVSWSGGFSAHPSDSLRKWDLGCWTPLYLPQTNSLNIFQHSEIYYPFWRPIKRPSESALVMKRVILVCNNSKVGFTCQNDTCKSVMIQGKENVIHVALVQL